MQTAFFSSSQDSIEENSSLEQSEESLLQITQNHSPATGGSIVEINHPSGALISVTLPSEESNPIILNRIEANRNSPSEKEFTEGDDSILQENSYENQNLITFNPTIKCYTSDDICLRYFFKDISSVSHLKSLIAEDIETNSFDLEYVDEDCDHIIITQRTTVSELRQHGKSIRCKIK